MDRRKATTYCRQRGEPRRKRAPKRAVTLTSVVLGYAFAFSSLFALHLRLHASLRYGRIARDRRGSFLCRLPVNNPG